MINEQEDKEISQPEQNLEDPNTRERESEASNIESKTTEKTKHTLTSRGESPDDQEEEPLEIFDAEAMKKGFFSLFKITDGLLKNKTGVFHAFRSDKNSEYILAGMILSVLLMGGIYGVIMGMFDGGIQILYAAIKVPLLVMGTGLICFPTLYIFNAMTGSKISFRQSLFILGTLVTTTMLILMGFAPIIWFFSVSVGGYVFMIFLHILMFAIASFLSAAFYATKALWIVERRLSSLSMLSCWFVLYFLVLCQMAAYLQPFIKAGPFFTGERMFFLELLIRVVKNAS